MKINFQLSRFFRKSGINLLLIALSPCCFSGEIALSFDDAPMHSSDLMSSMERAEKLSAALQKAGVDEVTFYCNTNKIKGANSPVLQYYIGQGFHIGNHSHSHRSASKIPVSEYLRDVKEADTILREYNNFLPLHRFPYLRHGKNREEIENIQQGLRKLGYQNGYVTVDNFDFYLNYLFVQAHKNQEKVDIEAFRRLYVDYLWSAIVYYDALAQRYLKRSPKHVLLLHENDVAALFIGDLVNKIRAEGWTIISNQQAYQDPIAKQWPQTLILNQGRVAALAYDNGASEEDMAFPKNNTNLLDTLFQTTLIKD